MRNYLTFGPLRIKVSNRYLANWGYERIGIGGLALLSRTNGGDIVLASYHPRHSITWYWSITLGKSGINRGWIRRAKHRTGPCQWHDYYRLPFINREIIVSRQTYHLPRTTPKPKSTTCEKCGVSLYPADFVPCGGSDCPLLETFNRVLAKAVAEPSANAE